MWVNCTALLQVACAQGCDQAPPIVIFTFISAAQPGTLLPSLNSIPGSMESLIALGFAANVVQFVDFTTRVVSESIKIYRARTQSCKDHTIAKDLGELELQLIMYTNFIEFDDATRAKLNEKSLRNKLQERGLPTKKAQRQHVAYNPIVLDLEEESREVLHSGKVAQLSGCDREIFRVCLRCEDVALSLRQGIAQLKGSSKSSMWSSFAEALKTI
jgi:hypothetical protein